MWNRPQDLCPYRHSLKVYTGDIGAWVRGDNEDLGVLILGNGQPQFRMRCRNCGAKSGPLPRVLVLRSWGMRPADIAWLQHNKPSTYPACTYRDCDQSPTENHHFAPYNTFGDDADNWPCLPLCVEHHRAWHRAMDGYRWRAKRVAS